MIQVPGPIKKVFGTFPLIRYGPLENSTSSNDKFIDSHKYHFENTSEKEDKSSFTLCINNAVELKTNEMVKFIPSDPLSLGYALILCFKNKLKLPSTASTRKSHNSMMKMSYNASPNGQLPMLIEDENESRNVRSSHSINTTLITTNLLQDPESVLFNDLIETKFYDLWILCLLTENIGNVSFNRLFNVSGEIQECTLLNSLNTIQILQQLPSWNHFKVRHPYLFEEGTTINNPIKYATKLFVEKATKLNLNVLGSYYIEQLESFHESLKLLITYINTTKTEGSNILELKLVAYFVTIDQVLEHTKLKSFVNSFPSFLEHSYSILESY